MSETLELQELLSIRWVDTQKVTFAPGDILVLMHPGCMSWEDYQRVKAQCAEIFPGTQVVCLDGGIQLGVLSPETAV